MALKSRTWEWDFAVEGGDTGTIELDRGYSLVGARRGGVIPAGATVVAASVNVVTSLTNAANATLDVNVPGLVLPTELDAVEPVTLDDTVEIIWTTPWDFGALAAADNPNMVIGTAAITAGKLEITVWYVE